jgi:hypothetical protein
MMMRILTLRSLSQLRHSESVDGGGLSAWNVAGGLEDGSVKFMGLVDSVVF